MIGYDVRGRRIKGPSSLERAFPLEENSWREMACGIKARIIMAVIGVFAGLSAGLCFFLMYHVSFTVLRSYYIFW